MNIKKKVVRDLSEIDVSTRGPLTPLTTMRYYYSVLYCLSTIDHSTSYITSNLYILTANNESSIFSWWWREGHKKSISIKFYFLLTCV